jgi:poly-beta-1,6-N-acetyl-D-glucosamine biosynthesis protein PgaD
MTPLEILFGYYHGWERRSSTGHGAPPSLPSYPPVSILIPCHNETLVAWSGWLYLWLPTLLLVMAAVSGFRLLTSESLLFEAEGYEIGALLYGTLCSVCAFLLTSWTLFQVWRTRKRNRPQPVALTGATELAQDFGVKVHLVSRAQRARNLVLHFTQDGRVEHIEIRRPSLDEELLAG